MLHLSLVWAWLKQKLLASPQAVSILLTAAILALGTTAIYATIKAVRSGIEAAAEARWLREAERRRADHERTVAEANRRASEAAEKARQAAESEQRAREALGELEAILRTVTDDPVVFPRAIVRELRK